MSDVNPVNERVSFPVNYSTINWNRLGLMSINYSHGKRKIPTPDQMAKLHERYYILFIKGVCPNISDSEAKVHLANVNDQAWVRDNGRFIGSTRLVEEAIDLGGSDGLRRLLGEGFEWVFTQSDLTKQMNLVQAMS